MSSHLNIMMEFMLSGERALLLTHVAMTLMMTGLIWVIQLVHYPLFAEVGQAGYERYQAEHVRRITWLVAPLMLAELGCALCLALISSPEQRLMRFGALALLVVVWLSTALLQVPQHSLLAKGWSSEAHLKLLRGNWLRTLSWSARAWLALQML
jgi:hypothetical protein